MLLHAWWDPFDPFLFASMNTIPLWLLLVGVLRDGSSGAARWPAWRVGAALLAGVIALQNLSSLILPLRGLP